MAISDAVTALNRDMREMFGGRLRSVVAYAVTDRTSDTPQPTLVVVDALTPADLRACAALVVKWHESGLATPLILEASEFGRSLDAFPYEFGAILADHVIVSGENPFAGLKVDPADLRRACEIQARSHLLHLREGYIETQGRSDALAELIARSAAPLSALLRSVARLKGISAADSVLAQVAGLNGKELSPEAARRLFPDYLSAVEYLTGEIDQWGRV
ncbi:MAG TPA: hypothetical protein VF456_17690 [Vicinamibacterales bacterium]